MSYHSEPVGKVTLFITRDAGEDRQLLLLRHPYAGNQLPAGTIEAGETPEAAALREAAEETGLAGLDLCGSLGWEDAELPPDRLIVAAQTTVYSRPEVTSFDWASLPRGAWVRILRTAPGFTQVTYVEPDRWPDPQYDSMVITGWVANPALSTVQRRHFYHLHYSGHTAQNWTVHVDNHDFRLFWARLAGLPALVEPQDDWLVYLPREAGS